MKKTILIGIAVVVLALAGGIYYVFTNLNSIVAAAIEKYGSEAVQTAVRVDSVDIKLTEGSASIDGLTVANPEGFSAPHAFSLDHIGIGIDLGSLGGQPIVIDEISVRAPEVFYEINEDNKDNLSALKRNLAGAGKDTQQSEPAADQPKLLIRKVAFDNVALHADVIPLQRAYDVELPSIRMNGLGAPDGATPPRIARQILNTLLDRVKTEIDKRGIGRVRDKLDVKKQELKSETDEQLEQEKEQAREKLKGLLER